MSSGVATRTLKRDLAAIGGRRECLHGHSGRHSLCQRSHAVGCRVAQHSGCRGAADQQPGNIPNPDVCHRCRYPGAYSRIRHLAGGLARPKAKGILLDLARMQKLEIFPERGYFEVEPGVHLAKLRKALAAYNAMLPVFPGSELIATIGGAIAVNTSAHTVDASLGKPGDFVLGLSVVLPTGETVETGTESTRRTAGIEFDKVFCQLRGPAGRYHQAAYAVDAPTEVYQYRGLLPVYRRHSGNGDGDVPKPCLDSLFFEYLDEKSSKVGFEAVGMTAPSGAVAMMTVHSETTWGARPKHGSFCSLHSGNPLEARIVEEKKEWEKIWSSRAEAGNYLYRLGSSFGSEITVRVDHLRTAFVEGKEIILDLDSYKGTEFYSLAISARPRFTRMRSFRQKRSLVTLRKRSPWKFV